MPQRRLTQTDPCDGAPAEKAIDPFTDHAREVLDFDRGWTINPQHERARFAFLAFDRTLPLDFDRLTVDGNLGADDIGPTRHQFGGRKTLLPKRIADSLADKVAQRPGERAGGLVHGVALCHPSDG